MNNLSTSRDGGANGDYGCPRNSMVPQSTGHDTDKEKSPSVLAHRTDSQLYYTQKILSKAKLID